MVEIIKKNINKIIVALTLMLSLVSICFISTKTYAMSIDNNGNLVGNNLFNSETYTETTKNNATYVWNNAQITCTTTSNNDPFIYGTFDNLVVNTTYTISITIISGRIEGWGINPNYIVQPTRTSITFNSGNNTTWPLCLELWPENNNTSIVQIMLVYGNNAQNWEPYGIMYSETNYNNKVNELTEQYNELETNYEELEQQNQTTTNNLNALLNQSNIFTNENIQSQKIYFNNIEQTYSDWDYIFIPQQRTLNIDVNGFRDIYDGIGANTELRYEIILNNEFSTLNVIGKITTSYDIAITCINKDNQEALSVVYSTTSGELANGEFDFSETYNIKKIVVETTIEDNMYGRNYSYIDFGSNYTSGYLAGVNENNTYWKNQANKYEDTIRTKDNKIQELNTQIENLNVKVQQSYNDGYNKGYDIGNKSENSLYNMVIAIADTPISIFKQIFNFNILGLDISGFIFGIISLLIIIWLIKKII